MLGLQSYFLQMILTLAIFVYFAASNNINNITCVVYLGFSSNLLEPFT